MTPRTRTTRLMATLIFGLLFTGIGGAYLQSTAPAARADNPSLLEHAAHSAIPAGNYQVVTVPTTAKPAAPKPVVNRPKAPVRPVNSNLEPIVEIGTMEIPKIGLVHPIYHGITMRNIDKGPSHWPGTAMPGAPTGNSVFAGHRVTKTHPFNRIDEMQPGDKVYFTVNGVRSAYVMTGHEIVTPKEIRIVNQTAEPTATLFACHPKGSAKYRYVIHLALTSE